jgi:phage protein D
VFNYVTVEFPLAQVSPQRVSTVILTQTRYAHEVVSVRFRDWDVQYANIKPGDPAKVTFRNQFNNRDFVGYIHDIKPEITPGKRFTTISIIGASYILKQPRQRVYENTTAPDVIRSIAHENNFAVEVDDHPRVYPQIVQAGITDLQLMARLAQQCGYIFWVYNTTIKFKKVTSDYNLHRDSAPIFEMRNANDPQGSTLYSFNLTLGESIRYSDGYKSAVQVGGVDPITKLASVVTNQARAKTIRETSRTEFFDNYATDTVAPDATSAYYEAVAADERNRFPYRASVQVAGDPTLAPGMPVYLDGVDRDYNGYWIVLSAEHHVYEEKQNVLTYVTYLQVGTDSVGEANSLNNVKTLKPSQIKKRALIPNVRNTPASKSKLKKGTEPYANVFSQITRRGKGSDYTNKTPHIWIFDGVTTRQFVTPSVGRRGIG